MTRSARAFAIISTSMVASAVACSSPAPPVSSARWSEGPALPIARFEAYAAVAHGKVHFIGGITGVIDDIRTARPSRRVDVFDPSATRPTASSAS